MLQPFIAGLAHTPLDAAALADSAAHEDHRAALNHWLLRAAYGEDRLSAAVRVHHHQGQWLDLSGLGLRDLPPLPPDLRLRRLDLSDNRLTPPSSPVGSWLLLAGDAINEVNLSGNLLDQVPLWLAKHLPAPAAVPEQVQVQVQAQVQAQMRVPRPAPPQRRRDRPPATTHGHGSHPLRRQCPYAALSRELPRQHVRRLAIHCPELTLQALAEHAALPEDEVRKALATPPTPQKLRELLTAYPRLGTESRLAYARRLTLEHPELCRADVAILCNVNRGNLGRGVLK